MNAHIFRSPYYLWVATIESEDGRSAKIGIKRNLTGKSKGPRLACSMDIYGIDYESPHGQWMKALMTCTAYCPDDFVDWVKSFHTSRKTKTVTVEFPDHRIICKPGDWNGGVLMRPQNKHETELECCPF